MRSYYEAHKHETLLKLKENYKQTDGETKRTIYEAIEIENETFKTYRRLFVCYILFFKTYHIEPQKSDALLGMY